jgi:WD40 repeat protein
MADIFISYKSEERALPEALASDLRAAGYSVWWDVDLVGGTTFRAQILEQLTTARAVIVIWTPASVGSEFVLDEADHAKREGKLIPVRVQELDPRYIPFGHGQTQACLLSDRPRILGALQARGLSTQPAAAPRPRVPRRSWWAIGLSKQPTMAPVSQPAALTADERLWQEVSAEKSLKALTYYVQKFPNGARAVEADDLIWGFLSAENAVLSYRRYVELMPEGRHGAVAEFRIERLVEKRKAERAAELAQYEDAAQRLVRTLAGHMGHVKAVAFSQDGCTLASASSDDTLKLWEAASGLELCCLIGHTGSVHSVAFSRDGNMLASASWDHTIKLWDTASARELRTLIGHSSHVSFSPDGRTLASASDDCTLKLWDAVSGRELRTLTGHTSPVFSVAFSPDGRWLASGGIDCMLKLWDAASGRELYTLSGHTLFVLSVAFSPDSRTLASASSDKTVKLWDATSGGELRTLVGCRDAVNSVAFSPDGRYLLSGSCAKKNKTKDCIKGSIKLWDAATGAELHEFNGHSDVVTSVAFSPDGRFALTGSGDKTLKLWDVSEWTQAR